MKDLFKLYVDDLKKDGINKKSVLCMIAYLLAIYSLLFVTTLISNS